jgi:hypothetical protein
VCRSTVVDQAGGPVDMGCLGNRDLVAPQRLSDDVRERGIAEALRSVRAGVVDGPDHRLFGVPSPVQLR